jgi:tRNA (adenine22-N1)-methyltransferase
MEKSGVCRSFLFLWRLTMELILTPRLQAVAGLIRPGAHLADVGTDHAYLPVRLLLDGTIATAIAADLRLGPLARARETAEQYGVSDRISFRLCNGLTGVGSQEADTVTIAGMGGETIAGILEAAPWTRDGTALILQPMTSFPDLRGWLQKNGYRIQGETIAREGERLYAVLSVRGGDMEPLTPAELWVGRQSDDPLRRDYLTMMAGKLRRALRGQQAAKEPDQQLIDQLSEILDHIAEMEKEL